MKTCRIVTSPTATPPSINRKGRCVRFPDRFAPPPAPPVLWPADVRCQRQSSGAPARCVVLADTLREASASVPFARQIAPRAPERYRRPDESLQSSNWFSGNVSRQYRFTHPGGRNNRFALRFRDNARHTADKAGHRCLRRQMFMNALYFAYAG